MVHFLVCDSWVLVCSFKSSTFLACRSAHWEVLQRLHNSWGGEEEWEEHLLLGLLHQFLPSLFHPSPISQTLEGSHQISQPKFVLYSVNIQFSEVMMLDACCSLWIQIRRYVYHDVLRLDDAARLIDCAFVQVSISIQHINWKVDQRSVLFHLFSLIRLLGFFNFSTWRSCSVLPLIG